DRVPLSAGAASYLARRPLAEPPHGLKHAVAPVGAPQSAMEAAVTAVGQYESEAVWAPLDIAARSLCRRDRHLAAGQDQGERFRGVSWRNGFSSRTISAVRDSSTGDAAVEALGHWAIPAHGSRPAEARDARYKLPPPNIDHDGSRARQSVNCIAKQSMTALESKPVKLRASTTFPLHGSTSTATSYESAMTSRLKRRCEGNECYWNRRVVIG